VNYFSQTAGHDAWAMVAARLGNRTNRAAFARDFWFNSDSSMQNVLKQPAALRPDWPGAVASFRRALSRVKALSAERSMVSHCITRLPATSRDRARANADLESAMALREKLETEQQDADRRLREADDRWQMASSAVAAHRPGRPGLLALLSGRGRTTRRIWETEHAELSARFVAADRERDSVSRAAQDVANRLAAARRDEEKARSTCDRLTRELEELRRRPLRGLTARAGQSPRARGDPGHALRPQALYQGSWCFLARFQHLAGLRHRRWNRGHLLRRCKSRARSL
jgi:hypothetical protein